MDILEALAREALPALAGAELDIEMLATLEHTIVARVSARGADSVSVIVKIANHPKGLPLLRREVRFYSIIAPRLDRGVCPSCYLCKESDRTGALVLEDLRGETPPKAELPSSAMVHDLVQALARLHTDARKIEAIDRVWEEAFGDDPYGTARGRLADLERRTSSLLADERDSLEESAKQTLNSLTRLPATLGAAAPGTIAHGDAHFANALFADGGVRLIDWGNVLLGIGEIDLAHAIALNLPRSFAREIEEELLREYAAYCGVEPDRTRSRYKVAVLYAIASALGMREFGLPRSAWWTLLTNALDAASELGAIDELRG